MNAFTVMLYGLAVLVFFGGLVGAYSLKLGILGGIALSVVGVTLRVYTFTRDFMNAFTVMLYGLAVLVFFGGLVDAYSWELGILGGIALSVVGVTLRVYTFTRDEDEEFGAYEPRQLYER
jgi:ABC-type dipeptide/oligopeptide/nickel transport system permease subunit